MYMRETLTQMARYKDFEVRLYGPNGELAKIIPIVAESETTARMRAAQLCSEFDADSFEVYAEKCGDFARPAR